MKRPYLFPALTLLIGIVLLLIGLRYAPAETMVGVLFGGIVLIPFVIVARRSTRPERP